ncbi:hypothetical protein K7432_006392 [Basidiobolus ranarum]|uniref:Zn(2)-C6 fungal-type domain-containing protein n=1 Tax=Basidiobolus ranarum TaxID=34480 RepID=A0ABR2W2H0_9FUNG
MDHSDGSKPVKRKRLTQACDTCRKKKVKCDGNHPSCSNCIRLNVSCAYLPSFKKRGPRQGPPVVEEKLTGSSVEFFRRLSAPGSTQYSKINQQSSSSSSIPNFNPSLISIPALPAVPPNFFSNFSHIPIPSFDAGGTPFFGNIGAHMPPPYPTNCQGKDLEVEEEEEEIGDPLEKEVAVREKVEQVWPQSYLGNTSGLHLLTASGGSEKSPSPKSESESLCLIGADSLPPPQITEHLANIYFDVIYPQMPFIHRPTFFKRLKNKEIPPILILSICACVSRLATHPAGLVDDAPRGGEIFSERFRNILVLCLDDPCLSTTQALLIFSYFEYTNARISRAWMYLGMAVRMAQELGINRLDERGSFDDQSPSEWIEAETRRRVWWSCFIRDRLGSSSTGRSMAIDEQDTRVLLPCDESDFNNENPVESELLDISDNATHVYPAPPSGNTTKREKCIGYRAHWVRLVALLGRVSQFVNSPKFRKARSSTETLAKFASLESSLAIWAKTLPSQFRYPCKLVDEVSPNGYSRAAFITCIHILYHTAIILLYRSNLDLNMLHANDDPTNSLVADSWKRCISSANQIIAIIPEFYTFPPCYNYPHVCFGIFTAGTIYMHSLFSPNISTVVEETRSKLEHTYNTLLMLKKEWLMAGKYCVLLKGLVSIRGRVLAQRNSDKAEASELESLSPLTPEFVSKGSDFSGVMTKIGLENSKPMGLDSTHVPLQIDDNSLNLFDGFQNLTDMPFSQGTLFFDGLLSNAYLNSCTDIPTNIEPSSLELSEIGGIPGNSTEDNQSSFFQYMAVDSQGIDGGWLSNLTSDMF